MKRSIRDYVTIILGCGIVWKFGIDAGLVYIMATQAISAGFVIVEKRNKELAGACEIVKLENILFALFTFLFIANAVPQGFATQWILFVVTIVLCAGFLVFIVHAARRAVAYSTKRTDQWVGALLILNLVGISVASIVIPVALRKGSSSLIVETMILLFFAMEAMFFGAVFVRWSSVWVLLRNPKLILLFSAFVFLSYAFEMHGAQRNWLGATVSIATVGFFGLGLSEWLERFCSVYVGRTEKFDLGSAPIQPSSQ